MKVTKNGRRVVFDCTRLEAYLVQEAIAELKDNRVAGDWNDSVSGMLIHKMMQKANTIENIPWKFDIRTRQWL